MFWTLIKLQRWMSDKSLVTFGSYPCSTQCVSNWSTFPTHIANEMDFCINVHTRMKYATWTHENGGASRYERVHVHAFVTQRFHEKPTPSFPSPLAQSVVDHRTRRLSLIHPYEEHDDFSVSGVRGQVEGAPPVPVLQSRICSELHQQFD